MPRPTLRESLSDRDRILVSNMFLRNEAWETIFKYTKLEDTLTARQLIEELANELDTPWSEAMYMAHMDLAQTDHIMEIAAKEAESKSPRHMSEYQKLGTHRMRLVNQIDELSAKEEERGHVWEPSFNIQSNEFKVFQAAIEVFLRQKDDDLGDFEQLSPEDQTRFLEILAEGA